MGIFETKVQGSFLPHEADMAKRFGDDLGGGIANFGNPQQGIEGLFTKKSGDNIPFSLKQVTPGSGIQGGKAVFWEIKDNAKSIRDGFDNGDNLIKQNCILGTNPNTYIRVEVTTQMSKSDLLNYYNSIDESRRALLFGDVGVFKEIKIVTSNGDELVFNNYKLVP
jgi:hypothetical protein